MGQTQNMDLILKRAESWNHRAAKVLIILGLAGILGTSFVHRGQSQLVLALASVSVFVLGVKVAIRREWRKTL
jgi:hypothetical protein